MPALRDRITSSPLGREYFVAVTRGTPVAAAARAAGGGAFCAVMGARPAIERRTARRMAKRFCICSLRRVRGAEPVLLSDGSAARNPSYFPTGPRRGTVLLTVKTRPQVPTGDRSIRSPLLSEFRQP